MSSSDTAPGAALTGRSRWDGRRFSNVHGEEIRSLGEVLKWQLTKQAKPWPSWRENRGYALPALAGDDAASVTFIGHATFLLRLGPVSILTDPVYSMRASPVGFAGPKRIRAPGQPLDALPPIDLVLVSHNHYDHLDLATLRDVKARWSPATITGLGNGPLLAGIGLPPLAELDWWDTHRFGEVTVTYVPAQHFSARGLFDRNRCLWGGFVVEGFGKTVYFAADTGYCPHFREIAARFPNIDLALLPIGAYEPRWFMRPMHMNPADAVEAHRTLAPRLSLGMHFGTFAGLTDEGVDEPPEALAAACRDQGVAEGEFTVLDFGESRSF